MDLRPATREEYDEFSRAALSAFHREFTDEDRARYERTDAPDRSLVWFDDQRIVATTAAFTRTLTVPGAMVGCAAVTAVAVVPTHRRRGLLTGMMRRQLEDVRARGEPVAALWASEAVIYGRFGYGARYTTACAATVQACSTAPARGGRTASLTPSPIATAPSRCGPWSPTTATRSTRCAVVLEVADDFCPWNEGRYRLTSDGCEPTGAEPDLALDAALGAAYLGGTTVRELAEAGRVRELRAGAVARASAAFRDEVAPWCPETF